MHSCKQYDIPYEENIVDYELYNSDNPMRKNYILSHVAIICYSTEENDTITKLFVFSKNITQWQQQQQNKLDIKTYFVHICKGYNLRHNA